MRFIIDGHEFGMDDIGDITQQDMLDMVKQAGLGVQTWSRRMAQVPRLALADDGESVVVLSETEAQGSPERVDPDLVTESAPHLHAFLIMVWLGRRRSGEPTLKYADSTATPWRSLEMIPDPEDLEPEEVEEPGPSLPGSAPAGEPEAQGSTLLSVV